MTDRSDPRLAPIEPAPRALLVLTVLLAVPLALTAIAFALAALSRWGAR